MLNKYYSGLSRNTFLLAFSSFFSDVSTEMLYPVLPVFLTQIMHSGGSQIGLIEGVATATMYLVQGLSGAVSDRIQKRKAVAVAGFVLAALAKPLIGLSLVWQQVLGARFLDRLGAGTRSAPRDALIAASVGEKNRGKAFGLEGFGDNLGAFIGPLITVALIFIFAVNLRAIFYLAFIPGLLAIVMILLVREKPVDFSAKSRLDFKLSGFPDDYWKYLLVIGLFGIGNSSNAFLILQTKNLGVSLEITILIYAFYNLIAALVSYPSGSLSDKLGRKPLLLFSFLIFLITYLGFYLSKNVYVIAFLFGFYGLYQGVFRAVGKTFATDFVPAGLRASAVGWFSTVVGLSSLIASLAAGVIWDRISHETVFLFGGLSALAGILALLLFKPVKLRINSR